MKSRRKSPLKSLKAQQTKRLKTPTKRSKDVDENHLSIESKDQLFGYENQFKYLKTIVDNTILKGESNSLIICGDPGSGKTKLLDSYVQTIKDNENICVIHLNGYVHNNDLNTIKTIGRHLGITANVIKDIMEGLKNKCIENPEFRALIILDCFDVFCRRNQTLLYNLLDVLQNSSSICIIAMTTRLDSIDLLEKRVKSRLNQRIIQLVTPFDSFDDYLKFAIKLLNGKQMTDSLRETLKIQFSLNFSINELKRVLLEDMVSQKIVNESSATFRDAKLYTLSQLSKYEISVLLIANKYTKNQNTSYFHCSAVLDALRHLPQIKINKNMLFKIFYRLSETDLITRQSSVKSNELLLSEWTLFSLNIDDSHLNHILSSNSFPNYMKQI